MELFPLFLKLQGRQCLVVGAGRVAESKIESLVRCGAKVRVVAPAATEAIRTMADAGMIVGAVLWKLRVWLGKPDSTPPHYLLDCVRHSVFCAGFGDVRVKNPALHDLA